MTKDQIMAELKKRGADQAVLPFNGGGDEGGPSAITLMKDGNVLTELPVWPGAGHPDAQFTEALQQPIYDRWGGFSGDFHVEGTLVYDVKTNKAQLEAAEEQMSVTDTIDVEL